MKTHGIVLLLIVVICGACNARQPAVFPTARILPTNQISTPHGTPLPGREVIPLATMKADDPWLPFHSIQDSGVIFYAFSVQEAPFDNVYARKALAAAFDRNAFFEHAKDAIDTYWLYPESFSIATTLTPPEILGRDLTGVVGIPFSPTQARQYLTEAGYPDPSTFPVVTLAIPKGTYNAIEDAYFAAKMWKDNLGIQVEVLEIDSPYYDYIKQEKPNIFTYYWLADYSDPDNFLLAIFGTETEYNLMGFSDPDFDYLVSQAYQLRNDPAQRQILYIQAEILLCEDLVPLIPLFHYKSDYSGN